LVAPGAVVGGDAVNLGWEYTLGTFLLVILIAWAWEWWSRCQGRAVGARSRFVAPAGSTFGAILAQRSLKPSLRAFAHNIFAGITIRRLRARVALLERENANQAARIKRQAAELTRLNERLRARAALVVVKASWWRRVLWWAVTR
jgi:hypothetical protein